MLAIPLCISVVVTLISIIEQTDSKWDYLAIILYLCPIIIAFITSIFIDYKIESNVVRYIFWGITNSLVPYFAIRDTYILKKDEDLKFRIKFVGALVIGFLISLWVLAGY